MRGSFELRLAGPGDEPLLARLEGGEGLCPVAVREEPGLVFLLLIGPGPVPSSIAQASDVPEGDLGPLGHTSPEWAEPDWKDPGWDDPSWQAPDWQDPSWAQPDWDAPDWDAPSWTTSPGTLLAPAGALPSGAVPGAQAGGQAPPELMDVAQARWVFDAPYPIPALPEVVGALLVRGRDRGQEGRDLELCQLLLPAPFRVEALQSRLEAFLSRFAQVNRYRSVLGWERLRD